ncbi:MAG: hypothetical protein SOW34_08030 [Oliverpabstia sp.]|nr:hypothetical protein [Oliverpabstia sp.]
MISCPYIRNDVGDTGMQPIFTDEQLKNMSRENLAQALKLMQEHQTKLEAKQKILEEKVHKQHQVSDTLTKILQS